MSFSGLHVRGKGDGDAHIRKDIDMTGWNGMSKIPYIFTHTGQEIREQERLEILGDGYWWR